MRRREFILSAAYSFAAATSARGQQNLPVIGFLVAGTQASHGAWVATFAQRLSELGWTEGRNVNIEYRWAAGNSSRMAALAAEFVEQKVDVIVTSSYGAVAAKQATSTIPIVFAAYGDPVAGGLVQSLARPGGNVTGLTVQPGDLNSKRLELLRDIMPTIRRVAALINTSNLGASEEVIGIRTAAASLHIEAEVLEIRTADEIELALARIKGRAEALYVFSEPLTNANKYQIIKVANAAKIPTIFGFREFVDAGGLISYGPSFIDLFRRAAEFTDKILRGTKPADIPVQQPVKFDLIVSLKTAKALGLRIPETVLARADEVIE
jgi:putative tryptophan/tyrosine transport system substrate-binding protein